MGYLTQQQMSQVLEEAIAENRTAIGDYVHTPLDYLDLTRSYVKDVRSRTRMRDKLAALREAFKFLSRLWVLTNVTSREFLYAELREVRRAGQAEYAHDASDALRNFRQTAADTGTSMETVLMCFLFKHLDGIKAWVNGYKSQREPVDGRVKDATMYVILYMGIVYEQFDMHETEGGL
jgi:hypothetical protein